MSMPLPNLDDRTYAELVDESRALIPSLDPEWTDHNPADPGITLIELLAWLTEMLLYRLDRVPDAYRLTFLRLLNDPHWTPGSDLAENVRTTVLNLRRRYRAVTAEDYQVLAREASAEVARSHCVPRRDLSAGSEEERARNMPGHVSVIVVPDPEATATDSEPGAPLPIVELLEEVWNYLDPRRLLTARHHVVGPIYAAVEAEITVVPRSDVRVAELERDVRVAVERFLDPFEGGPEGSGWPFGRAVYVSDLYELLEGVRGVDYVSQIGLESHCPAPSSWCVEAAKLWHQEGDLIGLELAAHHLPWLGAIEVTSG